VWGMLPVAIQKQVKLWQFLEFLYCLNHSNDHGVKEKTSFWSNFAFSSDTFSGCLNPSDTC
jgi:hypothetical protein